MIEMNDNKVNIELEHRRKGGAFDTIARVMRSVGELNFRSGVVVRNRVGSTASATFSPSSSVYESYHAKTAEKDKFNLMYYGRNGTGEARNTNYIELFANSVSTSIRDTANGRIVMSIRRDGQQSFSSISIIDTERNPTYGEAGYNGFRIFLTGGEGNEGGVQVSHVDSSGNVLFAIAVDGDGIQMFGLPTSASGLSAGAIWNNSGVLNIVT